MDSPGPTTELCAPAEPMTAPSTTPLATNRVRAMVANNTMVRLIRRPAFLQRNGVSSVVRRHSQRPFISNRRSILPYGGRGITQELSLVLLGRCLRVANFRELRKVEIQLPRMPIPRTRVNKCKRGPELTDKPRSYTAGCLM